MNVNVCHFILIFVELILVKGSSTLVSSIFVCTYTIRVKVTDSHSSSLQYAPIKAS